LVSGCNVQHNPVSRHKESVIEASNKLCYPAEYLRKPLQRKKSQELFSTFIRDTK